MKVYVCILNYLPEFTDGRVSRTKAVADFFHEHGHKVATASLGHENVQTDATVKVKSAMLGASLKKANTEKVGRSLLGKLKFLQVLFYPDRYIFASIQLYRLLKQIVSPEDGLFISVPWFSLLLLTRLNARVTIVDFRDLFYDNPIFMRRRALDRLFLRFFLARADAVLVTTEQAVTQVARFYNGPVHVVPNGISRERFSILEQARAENQPIDGAHRIGYFGNLGGKRDMVVLFESLLQVKGCDIFVAGNCDYDHARILGERYVGSLPWTEMIRECLRCHVILVVIRHEEHAEFAIPGKIYEIMACGRPILLVCPQNAAALALVRKTGFQHLWIDSEGADYTILNSDIAALAAAGAEPVVMLREDHLSVLLPILEAARTF